MKTCSLVLVCVLTTAAARGTEYYHDFRTGAVGRPQLNIFGPDAKDYIHIGPLGMRIDLPAKRDKYAPTGIETRFPFRGDFEVTVRYEILAGDEPQKQYGSALNLYLRTSADRWQDATFGRAKKPRFGEVYVMSHIGDRQRPPKADRKPADTNKGALRLARTGNEIRFLVADQDGPFRELWLQDFSNDDVGIVRVSANPGQEALALQVNLLDLRIRADQLLMPAELAAAPPGAVPRNPAPPALIDVPARG